LVAPVVDLNGAAAGSGATLDYLENAGATAIAPTGVTTDVDSPDFNGGSLTVHFSANGAAEDQLSIMTDGNVTVSSGTVSVGGLAIGTVSGGANGSDLVVSFNTTDATPTAVSTLIEHIGYADNSDNPSTTARTLTFTVNDGASSGSDAATINITAVNDAPAATAPVAHYSATEQTSLDLKNTGLSVSDVDGNAGSETVTLSVAEGTLTVTPGTSGAIVNNSGTPSVTITGTLAQINALLNTDGTSIVSYIDNTDDPSASAQLTLAIHDNGNTGGGDQTANATATIDIAAVNDAPVNTVPAGPLSTPEDTALAITGLSVSDVDIGIGNITVTLSVTHGTIHVRDDLGPGFLDPGDFSAGTNDTSSVTFSCDPAFVNATLAALNGVVYTPDPNYNGSDTLTMLSDDGGATGSGGALTDSDPVAINVTAVNDAPVLTGVGDPGDTPVFTENGAPVVLDTDNNASVSDAELNVSPNNYAGATLTLARSGGANADDVFGSAGSLDLTDVNGTGENVSLDGGATFIGTWSQPGDGSISFTFNANATAADIDSVMRQITYLNTSDNPEASVPIDFRFDDGNGEAGGQAQGSGGAGITTGTITVQITQIDDAPVLLNVAPAAAYTIGSPGSVLSSTLGVFDADATAPSPITGIHSATVQIAAGFFAGDELFVNLASSGGHFLTADGDPTNISGSYAAGTLTLSGQDSIQHYQQILDAVSYRSTAADPSNAGADPNRTITWQVNDGALNSQTPAPAVGGNGPVNETVLHFDVAPKVDLDASGAGTGFTTTFTENGAPIAIVDTDVSIVDPDNANLDAATIVLTNAKATDALSIAGALPGGIDSSIDTSVPGQITLHLLNSASLADYQTALGQVRFANSSDAPNTTDRDITVSVTNGADSNVAHATVHVVAVNDAPVAANGSASGNEDTVIASAVSASDVDNIPAQLSYSLVGANGGAAHGTVIFHADGTFSYTPVHDFNGSDSFSFKANDTSLDSNVATESLTINAVNDAPVAANGSASGNEDTAIAGAVSASDVDNTPAQLSYALVGANGGAAHGTVALNANGSFTYTPVANFNGSDSFSFKASDGALNSNIATESLTISAVNDAPVNSVPGALSVESSSDAAITGLAVSDVDAVSLTTSLHVDHGTLTVAAVGGAAVVGSGTGTVTLSGSVAQIDATLGAASNVIYRSAFDFNGTDHLTMTTNDGGSTGSGGPLTDIDIVDIVVAGSSLAPPHLPFSGSAGSAAGPATSFSSAFSGLAGASAGDGFPLAGGFTSPITDTSHVVDAGLAPPHLGSSDFHLT
jgi:VCBS repeat-containing protein